MTSCNVMISLLGSPGEGSFVLLCSKNTKRQGLSKIAAATATSKQPSSHSPFVGSPPGLAPGAGCPLLAMPLKRTFLVYTLP